MKSKLTKIGLGLSLAFTLSCSGNDGASCTVQPNANGYDVLCDGKKVGELSNGEKGETGAAGTSCTVQPNAGGYDVLCGGENVGQLSNGEVCTIVNDASNSWYMLTCGSATAPLAWCGEKIYDPSKMTCHDGSIKFVFTDARDNMRYKAAAIGEQIWMAQNMNYAAIGSKCGNGDVLSETNTTTCDMYGRLYNWATAMNLPSKCNGISSTSDADCAIKTPFHQGVCPSGWHLPNKDEWGILILATGGHYPPYAELVGRSDYLKATFGWNNVCVEYQDGVCSKTQSGNGTDNYGFSALPGGYGNSDGSFGGTGDYGSWWTATTIDYTGTDASCINDNFYLGCRDLKDNLQSVRCVQD